MIFYAPVRDGINAQPPDIACKNMCQPPSLNPWGFGGSMKMRALWTSRPGVGFGLVLKAACPRTFCLSLSHAQRLAGMTTGVDLLEVVDRDTGVNLGGLQRLMGQKFLDVPDR